MKKNDKEKTDKNKDNNYEEEIEDKKEENI